MVCRLITRTGRCQPPPVTPMPPFDGFMCQSMRHAIEPIIRRRRARQYRQRFAPATTPTPPPGPCPRLVVAKLMPACFHGWSSGPPSFIGHALAVRLFVTLPLTNIDACYAGAAERQPLITSPVFVLVPFRLIGLSQVKDVGQFIYWRRYCFRRQHAVLRYRGHYAADASSPCRTPTCRRPMPACRRRWLIICMPHADAHGAPCHSP